MKFFFGKRAYLLKNISGIKWAQRLSFDLGKLGLDIVAETRKKHIF